MADKNFWNDADIKILYDYVLEMKILGTPHYPFVSKKKIDVKPTQTNHTNVRSSLLVARMLYVMLQGKTTIVHRFLEKDETPKPTIAIDYSYGRKIGKSLIKNVVHIWEIGYLSSSLMSAAMSGLSLTHSPAHTTILLMLDLSQPESLWTTFEEIFSIIRSAMKMSYDDRTIQDLKQRRINECRKASEKEVDPFPLKLCIIGGKYDQFKGLDIGKRELIGKTLRAIAHTLQAGLYYHSSKDKMLVRQTKDVLSHYGFGTQLSNSKCVDFEKPLAIAPGTDCFSSIDLQFPPTRPAAILDAIKHVYVASIPQESKNNDIILKDPSNDFNFNEPIIDKLRAQREEEIGILLHDMLEGRTPQILIPDPS